MHSFKTHNIYPIKYKLQNESHKHTTSKHNQMSMDSSNKIQTPKQYIKTYTFQKHI